MNRKHFLQAAAAAGAAGLIPFYPPGGTATTGRVIRVPPYLAAGDPIGITAPAGFITEEEMAPALLVLRSWGFQIKIGNTINRRHYTFGGTDEERRADLQQMLNDPSIKAIMCARGGYGAIRIVDGLDWRAFMRQPKWVIGFSDITVLHSHIHSQCGVATIHSKMTNSFPDNWTAAEAVQIDTINSIRDALTGAAPMQYTATPNLANRKGRCSGVLVGGNLKTLETLSGSQSDIKTDGKILFVEDTAEYLYSIDRMFWHLKRSRKLENLEAMIVGGFNPKPDDAGKEFGKTVEEIVLEKVREYHYPVCFDFPVGHQRSNFALKCGVTHTLDIQENAVALTQIL